MSQGKSFFIARWRAGKDLCIPDALSYHHITSPHEDNGTLPDVSMQDTVALRAISSLNELQQHPSLADLLMEELQ